MDECVQKCTDKFTKEVGVSVTPNEVEIAHRLGQSRSDRPRPIIVCSHSRKVKSDVLMSRRKLKQTGISIGEDLTQANYRLLTRVKEHSAVLSAWSSHGNILAKLKEGETVRVDLSTDFDKEFARAMSRLGRAGDRGGS